MTLACNVIALQRSLCGSEPRWCHCRTIKADAMAAKHKAAVTHALFGQMKEDFSAAMHEDDCAIPGRCSRRSIAMSTLGKKWILGPGQGQNAEAQISSNASMRRQLLAVELKAGLADSRAARLQRSSKAHSAQHVAENLQLLHEHNRLRRANQHLQEALNCARAESDTSRLSNPRRNLFHISAGCSKPSVSVAAITESELVDSGGDVVEYHGEHDDLDAAFVSLGSPVPPSRPTSKATPLHAHEPSLASSQSVPKSVFGYKAGVHQRKWPQTAGRMNKDRNLGFRQGRPISAKEIKEQL